MSSLFPDAPFVLLEDARPGAADARLFTSPLETIVATELSEVEPALARVRAALRDGRHVAGWMSYEAGCAFEARLTAIAQRPEAANFPLVWFGVFDRVQRIAPADLVRALPDPQSAYISLPRPRITRAAYDDAFTRIQRYIAEGDIYQVNLSYRADLTLHGHPLAAYAQLRSAGQGGWSGVVFDGARWLLSTSPELFFSLSAGALEARPMKGTAKRRADPAEDRAAAAALKIDPKETAENVMIVDLLRNDLSRVAKRGSVNVPALFTVETYPTLHTLTSTVRAELRDDLDAVDALRTLFPCGSITGAPKIRAMEIIRELETDARGPYTGAIGWLSPNGDAEFNVVIRTIAVADGKAELGLGSAIVHESTADNEWKECRTKGAFVARAAPRFELIETMRCEAGVIWRLDLHLRRLGISATALGFAFDADQITQRLCAEIAKDSSPIALRLTLATDGAISITRRPLPRFDKANARVALAPLPVAADDFRLRHKTTLRDFYDDARAASGCDEVIFADADGFITEGSFTNVFVQSGDQLLTPPLRRGLLPGILRASLIESGRALERDLQPSDLAGGFFLGNALRGLTPAQLDAAEALPRAATG